MAIQGIHSGISLNSYQNLNRATNKNVAKLSSGKRINSSADDASGLAISRQMEALTTQFSVGSQNAQSGLGLIRTSEGALDEVSGILNRMQELSMRSSSGLYNDSQRAMLQKEFGELTQELDRIAESTNYNGIQTLNGSEATGEEVAINTGGADATAVPAFTLTAKGLGLDSLSIADASGAANALKALSQARDQVSSARGDYGGVYNGLEHTINSLNVAAENTTAARSQIEDVDMALLASELKKNNILSAIQNAMADISKRNDLNILKWLQ